MTEFTIRQGAPEGRPFAADAFDAYLGRPVPDWAGGSCGAPLLRAEVVDDGWYAHLTVEAPEQPPVSPGLQ